MAASTADPDGLTGNASPCPAPAVDKEFWFNGRLSISQPAQGYRYAIDPAILSYHVPPLFGGRVLDLGCGCGIISLILGFRYPAASFIGVEIQEQMAWIAARNVEDNRMEHRIRILHQDANTLDANQIGGPVDMIISNPPYQKLGTGRLNPDSQKAMARHELGLTMAQVFAKAAELLLPSGQLYTIYPAPRLSEIKAEARRSGFDLAWICFVRQSMGEAPFRVMVCAARNPKGSCRVLPPFCLHGPDNLPTIAHQALFKP